MDQPVDPQTPQEPHHPAEPVSPAEPAPGTVLPLEDDEQREERRDDDQLQGEGGEGGAPYDGGEIPSVGTDEVDPDFDQNDERAH